MKGFNTHRHAAGVPCLHCLAASGIYIHLVPGRLRIELPALRENPNFIDALEMLKALPGVRRAGGSQITGRALVEFDSHVTTAEAILDRLDDLGAFSPMHQAPVHGVVGQSILDLASEFIVENSLKLALSLVA